MLRKVFGPVMILLLYIGTISTVTLAGDPPSRLGSQVYKLEAVLLVLESVKLQLEVRFIDGNIIDANSPLPAVEGLVGRFQSMAFQLQVLESRIVLAMGTLPGNGPVSSSPGDVEIALIDIRDAAGAVIDLASELSEILTGDPYYEGAITALDGVETNAEIILNTVLDYLRFQ